MEIDYENYVQLAAEWTELTKVDNAWVNSLRSRQNGRHFADVFKCIFLNENLWILLKISLKFVPEFQMNNIPALVQIYDLAPARRQAIIWSSDD